MFRIKKVLEIAVAHHLSLPYQSKCLNSHGHNLLVTVYCQASSEEVKKNNGMVLDFTYVKKQIEDELDHKNLNDVLDFNPTAENIAEWVCHRLYPTCYRVDVQESLGNVATYIDEDLIDEDLMV